MFHISNISKESPFPSQSHGVIQYQIERKKIRASNVTAATRSPNAWSLLSTIFFHREQENAPWSAFCVRTHTFVRTLRLTAMRAANAKNAPTTNSEPPKNCAHRYLKSPAPPPLAFADCLERSARRAPAIGGPASIPRSTLVRLFILVMNTESDGTEKFLPGAIAAVNMPVLVPICDWSLVIWATHEDAKERYEALQKPNLHMDIIRD